MDPILMRHINDALITCQVDRFKKFTKSVKSLADIPLDVTTFFLLNSPTEEFRLMLGHLLENEYVFYDSSLRDFILRHEQFMPSDLVTLLSCHGYLRNQKERVIHPQILS